MKLESRSSKSEERNGGELRRQQKEKESGDMSPLSLIVPVNEPRVRDRDGRGYRCVRENHRRAHDHRGRRERVGQAFRQRTTVGSSQKAARCRRETS